MSIGRYIVVVCDCDQGHTGAQWQCFGESDPEHTVAAVRRYTRTRGWKRSRGRDFCPGCMELGHHRAAREEGERG